MRAGPRGAGLGRGVLVTLIIAAAPARAAAAPPGLVILVEPSDASPATSQSLRRIKEEVAADRFEVVVASSDAANGPASSTWRSQPGALIVLFGDPKSGSAELCVISRTSEHTAVRRVVVVETPEKMPDALASRALELLRATALELSVEAPKPVAPREPRVPTQAATAEEPSPLNVQSGLVLVQNAKGLPLAFAPILRLGLELARWVDVRTSVAGLGTRPRVETPYGSATVAQSFFLLELVVKLTDRGALRPFASLGGGLLHVAVSGSGVPPYVGEHPERWSASVDGGVGLALPVRSRAAVVAELHCLVASPHPSIRFVDEVAATVGYPSLMLTLALEVTP